jgi:hypothetical protein
VEAEIGPLREQRAISALVRWRVGAAVLNEWRFTGSDRIDCFPHVETFIGEGYPQPVDGRCILSISQRKALD